MEQDVKANGYQMSPLQGVQLLCVADLLKRGQLEICGEDQEDADRALAAILEAAQEIALQWEMPALRQPRFAGQPRKSVLCPRKRNKAMTEPSDAAIEEALRLINALETREGVVWTTADAHLTTIRALALRLDFEDRVAREAAALIEIWGGNNDEDGRQCALPLRSLMLPDPVDPDEELAREVAKNFGRGPHMANETAHHAALATIKRLREQGRLTDAK